MTTTNAEATSNRALPVVLALIAGYLDGYGLRFLGAYLSFMSGNTTITGMESGEGAFHAAAPSALAIAFVVTGSVFGNLLVHSRLRQSHRAVFALIAVLLGTTAALEQAGMAIALAEIALLSLAMGMMNPAVSKIGSEPVSLTFVTGTLNRMGGHLAAALSPTSMPGSTGSRSTELRRAGIDASMWSGFLIGAVLSGLLASAWKPWALWPPFFVIAMLVFFGRLTSSRVILAPTSKNQSA
jgi:uncharacterized membrane protein YoaK (UPF0700 family)